MCIFNLAARSETHIYKTYNEYKTLYDEAHSQFNYLNNDPKQNNQECVRLQTAAQKCIQSQQEQKPVVADQ